MKKKSEYGKGFTYCLGLFLMHAERHETRFGEDYGWWFNGAADHLFELQIPKDISKQFQKQIQKFQDRCLELRLLKATKEDYEQAIKTAKKILLKYDKFNGISTTKGTWE